MPVAQKSGRLLAHRLAGRIHNTHTEAQLLEKFSTDYNNIPTTVFSPTEYSFVGLTEEEAIAKFGEDNIDIYHREAVPLELTIYKGNDKTAYMKVITMREDR